MANLIKLSMLFILVSCGSESSRSTCIKGESKILQCKADVIATYSTLLPSEARRCETLYVPNACY